MRRLAVVAAVLVVPVLAGCLASSPASDGAPSSPDLPAEIQATPTIDGDPVPLRVVEARDVDGSTLWYASTGPAGRLDVTVGPEVAELILWDGKLPYRVGPSGGLTVADDLAGRSPPAELGERVTFQDSKFPVQLGTTCLEKTDGDTSCGLDEPSVRVDGRGWIYYTAVCCFVEDSPIWVSKDGGATFQRLHHPVKDRYGNEGTISLDSAGNLYYMDIDLATFGIATWDPQLEPQLGYRRTGEPLIDRPWIRAGEDGTIHAVYNTGVDTVAYRSTDHATTFSATPVARYGAGLAGAYSDARHNVVGMTGYGDYMESRDGGETWSERQSVEGCEPAGSYAVETAAVDEAGTVWHQLAGCVVGRQDGNWTAPTDAIPSRIDPFFTWVDAGAPGSVAVAYYGQVTHDGAAEALGVERDGWYLFASFSTDLGADGGHWATVLVDEAPVGYGDLGRRLGDFMQVDVGPEGQIHVAYARNPEMDDSAKAAYRRTSAIDGMAPSRPLVGPFS